MVRRDGRAKGVARAIDEAAPCCTSPAGESPVPVGAGAPGSRLPRAEEIPSAKRSVESPIAGSNEAGRNQLKAVQASSDYQPKGDWECRAGHVAAKADAQRPASPDRALGLPGVLAVARFEGEVRNTRDPSAPPTSGKHRAYKPVAKTRGGQWESEGLVVPMMAAQENAVGGKGPCSGQAVGWGKREGMVAAKRPNNPREKARELTTRLWATAKWGRARRGAAEEPAAGGDAPRNCARARRATAHAAQRRPPVSRVRENRTHGLTGGPTRSTQYLCFAQERR